MKPLAPYFFPTTTVLIDDNEDILKKLLRLLDLRTQPSNIFINPQEALNFINNNHHRQTFLNSLYSSRDEDEEDYEGEGGVLSMNPRTLLTKFNTDQRFQQISVLIIDYEMPGMNGIEFCKRMTNPHIKIILLTGIADEGTAIDAFNEGIIDRYVRKHDPDLVEKLRVALSELRQEYFQNLLEAALATLRQQDTESALFDPVFKEYFEGLVKDHRIQEYYLANSLGTFLMMDNKGAIHSLFTLDDDQIDVYLNAASTEGFPDHLRHSLREKERVPCYYDPVTVPYGEPEDLSHFLYPPTVIQGHNKTYYSVFGQGHIETKKLDLKTYTFKQPL